MSEQNVVELPAHIRVAKVETSAAPGTDTAPGTEAPNSVTTIPEPPAELHADARPYWDHYGEQLQTIGAFLSPDTQALAILANLTEEYWRADGRERELPTDVANNVRWTAISHKRSVEKQLKTMLDAFGLTPAARIKVRG